MNKGIYCSWRNDHGVPCDELAFFKRATQRLQSFLPTGDTKMNTEHFNDDKRLQTRLAVFRELMAQRTAVSEPQEKADELAKAAIKIADSMLDDEN